MELEIGEVHLAWVDGEIRNLTHQGDQIARRILFTVRYGEWDTAIATQEELRIDRDETGVSLRSELRFRGPDIDYSVLVDARVDMAGRLRYSARGASTTGTVSRDVRRCGIMVLLGAEEYGGANYVCEREDGSSFSGTITRLIDSEIRPIRHSSMHLKKRGGTDVSVHFTGSGFGFEDQRAFADSSWKLFSALGHSYPTLEPSDSAAASVTLESRPAGRSSSASSVIAPANRRLRLPRIVRCYGPYQQSYFSRLPATLSGSASWSYTPLVNLDDEDIVAENVSSIGDQAATARARYNGSDPQEIELGPISLRPPASRPGRRRHSEGPLEAAYVLAVLEQLVWHGYDSASFSIDSVAADAVLRDLTSSPDSEIRGLAEFLDVNEAVHGLAIRRPNHWELWVSNLRTKERALQLAPSYACTDAWTLTPLGRWTEWSSAAEFIPGLATLRMAVA